MALAAGEVAAHRRNLQETRESEKSSLASHAAGILRAEHGIILRAGLEALAAVEELSASGAKALLHGSMVDISIMSLSNQIATDLLNERKACYVDDKHHLQGALQVLFLPLFMPDNARPQCPRERRATHARMLAPGCPRVGRRRREAGCCRGDTIDAWHKDERLKFTLALCDCPDSHRPPRRTGVCVEGIPHAGADKPIPQVARMSVCVCVCVCVCGVCLCVLR